MTKLTVFLEGTVVIECELVQGREYLLGRASSCDIVISHPKVSRQHAKITFDGKDWRCSIISKYGNLLVNGHVMTEDFSMAPGSQFSIPPFEIKFTMENEAPPPVAAEPTSAMVSQVGKEDSQNIFDKTQTGSVALKILLSRLDSQGKIVEEINLGKEPLVAGRSKSCNFHLNAPEASRKHFTIEPSGSDYVLTDLDSANKTYVNGKEIKRHVLQSGDEIKVGDEKLRFEQFSPDLEKAPENVPDVPSPVPDASMISPLPPQGQPGQPMQPAQPNQQLPVTVGSGNQPAVIKISPENQGAVAYYVGGPQYPNKASRKRKRQNRNLQMGLLIGLAVVIVFEMTNSKKDTAGNLTSGSSGGPVGKPIDPTGFDRLTPDQQKSIDETYNLAMTLYTTGKYDLAAIELNKIFLLVTSYKDARNIQALCQQALAIKKQQDDAARIKAEQEALKQQVNQTLDRCESLLKQKRYDEVETCTGDIADRDPDNERAQNLVLAAKEAQNQIEANRQHAADMDRRKKHATELFSRAEKDFRAKRFIASIGEYESVEHSSFADKGGLKEKAKQGVAAAKEQLQKQSDALVAEGKELLDSKDYKSAYNKFTQAFQIYPNNGNAADMKDQAFRELHLQVKNMYDESVIEEDLGNIESAKKKWHTILTQDLKFDDFYLKAQIKLRKYEK